MYKHIPAALTLALLFSATPAFAQTGANVNVKAAVPGIKANIRAEVKTNAKTLLKTKEVDAQCMINAIDKRDNAIIAAVDASSASVKTALTARRDALKAAWALTDKTARRKALSEAWRKYGVDAKAARETLRKGKTDAWNQFYTDRKSCGTTVASDDATTVAADGGI